MERKIFIAWVMGQVRLRRWVRANRKAFKYAGIAALFAAQTGCVAIVGTPGGIRAYQDGQNGLVTNGKASPDIKSAHWQMREAEEREHTTRETAPGMLQRWFGGGAQ